MNNRRKKQSGKALSIEQTLQKAFGASVVSANVDLKAELSESVSNFLRAMDNGKARVSKCKIAFGD